MRREVIYITYRTIPYTIVQYSTTIRFLVLYGTPIKRVPIGRHAVAFINGFSTEFVAGCAMYVCASGSPQTVDDITVEFTIIFDDWCLRRTEASKEEKRHPQRLGTFLSVEQL